MIATYDIQTMLMSYLVYSIKSNNSESINIPVSTEKHRSLDQYREMLIQSQLRNKSDNASVVVSYRWTAITTYDIDHLYKRCS